MGSRGISSAFLSACRVAASAYGCTSSDFSTQLVSTLCCMQMVEKERRTGSVHIEQDGQRGLWRLLDQPLKLAFALAVFAALLSAFLSPA